MAFTHLHVHSMYSTFDGIIKIPELFRRANELGMKGIALTDHGNMYGVAEFLSEAKNYPDIKPIVGCELYIYDDNQALDETETDSTTLPRSYSAKNCRHYHLIALAKNLTGYRNLCKLATISATIPSPQGIEGRKLEKTKGYKARLHRSDLSKYREGLIISSACIGGDIPQAILNDDMQRARELVLWYKSIFGDDFYLEVSQHKSQKPGYRSDLLQKQIKANLAIFDLAEEFGVKVVATNDVHFLNAEDAFAHDVRLCISTNSRMSDSNRFQYTGQEYLKTEEEMLAIFPEHPEVIANTIDVYEKIERYDIQSVPLFPEPTLPESVSSADEYLSIISREGLSKRLNGKVHPDDMMRLDHELEVVRQKHCAPYFLMLKEIIDAARQKGIVVGPGRGYAPSMTLNYALGLTDLLPSRYGLVSELCFNGEDNKSYPDIDFDFSLTCDDDKCSLETIYEICSERYGDNNVSKIIIFSRLNHANTLKRVFHAMGCSSERMALEVSDKLLGLVQGVVIHTSGVAVCGKNLQEMMPIQRIDDQIVGQYDAHYMEKLGVIKLDFLGLPVLDKLKEASKRSNLPENYDDSRVYEFLTNVDTSDIFMLESRGTRKWLKSLKPTNLDHLAALEALYRPNWFKYIPLYIEAKEGSSFYEHAPRFCRDCLGPTYGLLLFKEQAIKIAKKCSFTDIEAVRLCKALINPLKDELHMYEGKFMTGALNNGATDDDAKKAWALMMEFGPMLYPYSIAISRAILTYKNAWVKCF